MASVDLDEFDFLGCFNIYDSCKRYVINALVIKYFVSVCLND